MMLGPETFVARWQEFIENEPEMIRDSLCLMTCPLGSPALRGFSSSSSRFLVEAGLPQSCAPFLGFLQVGQGLPSLISAWRLEGVRGFDSKFLSRYHMLGSDSAGNPLCVDITDPDKVYMVDHEDAFRSRFLVASSIPQLAEALLAIHTLPYEEFGERFRQIDPIAATSGSWLITEVRSLVEEDA